MKIGNSLYLDYQASSPLDGKALEAMISYMGELFANPHSVDHSAGWQAAQAIETAASQVAQLIGADADEIIFTSGATESNNLALLGFGRRAVGGRRRRVLVSAIEHKSVLTIGRILEHQLGYGVEYVPVDKEGCVDITSLEARLEDDVFMVSIMAVNNEIGTIQNIKAISELAKPYNAYFHCDAAQAPCAMDLGGIAEYVDLLSLSGHKMYGPKGIGTLYVRRDLQNQIEPIIYGGGQQNALRSGTVPTALCVGMGAAAMTFVGDDGGEERESLQRMRDKFVKELEALGWHLALNGSEGKSRHPGNANICFKGFAAHDVLATLQPRLAASTGSACTSGIPEASHVLRAIGLTEPEAESSIRFSFGRGTSEEDLAEAIGLIDEGLSRLTGAGVSRAI